MGDLGRFSSYRATSRHRLMIVSAMTLVTVVLFFASICSGEMDYSISEVLRTLLHPDQVSAGMESIVWNTRLPQALTAILAGVALGMAGAEMQTILDNPLAEPYTLGVSMAAAFGASLVIAFGIGRTVLGGYASVAMAFVLAMVCCTAIYAVSRTRRSDRITIVLTGVAMLFLFQALVSLVQSLASRDAANAITFWTFGSLGRTDWPDIALMVVVVLLVSLFFVRNMWRLTSLKLGDGKARSIGVDVVRLRRNTLVGVSVMTAVVISFTGTIGFIGLVGPHIARMLVGEDQRFFLPVSALSGALFLTAAHFFTRSFDFAMSVPIGIVTSLIGVPFFMYMILKGRRTIS